MNKNERIIPSRQVFVSWRVIESNRIESNAGLARDRIECRLGTGNVSCVTCRGFVVSGVAIQDLGFLLTSLAVNSKDARLGLGNLKKPPRDRLRRTATVDEVEVVVPEAGPCKVRRLAFRVWEIDFCFLLRVQGTSG